MTNSLYRLRMLLVAMDAQFQDHDTGSGHPERPARLRAVRSALIQLGLDGEETHIAARRATRAALERVHTAAYLDSLEHLSETGGGQIDGDTVVSARSWDVARLAAGTGLAAIDKLRAGDGSAALLAVRPPGHHAVRAHGMGFCLINNIAVAAGELTALGNRVVIIDWDAHHGNGTQDIFEADPNVLYVSLHQWPLYPGTGSVNEVGTGPGRGTTINIAVPPGATGDVYLSAFDRVIEPACERFRPDWVLISAGFDAHRADPLTDLGLSSGDFADLTRRAMALAPAPGRFIMFLEGGYDLEALQHSVIAAASTMMDETQRPEPSTHGGPNSGVVERVREIHGLT
jgi:acetoin utilization deacetylase AcuC-like enzyme